MSSPTQDERHERMLEDAKNDVFSLERQIRDKKAELKILEDDLAKAKEKLSMHEGIDARRN